MSEWKEYKLGDVANLLTGFPFKGDQYEMEGNLKVVRGENVTLGTLRWDSEKHWNNSTNELEKYFLKEDDIVIGMDGSRVGRNRAIIKADELPLILAQRVTRLRAKKDFDQKFVWYSVYNNKFQNYVEAINTGTSIPHISPSQINDFELLAPPLSEQKLISETLSSLDDKIDLLHRQKKTLEALAETLFRQWFVEEAEVQSEKKLLLGDLIATISNTHKFSSDKIIFLNTSDIYQGDVLVHEAVDVKTLPGQAKKSIQRNDILFSEIRPANGRYAYINFDAENYVVSTKLMVLRSKNVLSQAFIYFYLTNSQTVDYLQMLAESRSGTFPQITFDQLQDLKINIPSNSILKDAIIWCETALEKIKSNSTQIKTLTQLRDLLLPKLMSGQVRVNN
jgi:type I restriction enzyme S subunit